MESESTDAEPHSSAANATAEQGTVQTPDQEARQDLVRWCTEHGLPVPPPAGTDQRAPVA
jgi:hypothetical protein